MFLPVQIRARHLFLFNLAPDKSRDQQAECATHRETAAGERYAEWEYE